MRDVLSRASILLGAQPRAETGRWAEEFFSTSIEVGARARMSMADPKEYAPPGNPQTALRRFADRALDLSLDSQMVECVDLLQQPELLVAEIGESVEEVREQKDAGARTRLASSLGEDRTAFFYPSRELFVQGDGCSFTCLATELDFQEEKPAVSAEPGATHSSAIDYAGVTCESRPFPVLGFSQRNDAESAYPLLLRGLTNLIDLLLPRRFDVLEREVYRGLLGPAPVFDLALILWDDEETPDPRRPLCELTRDLAEILKEALDAHPGFPPVLNDIVCLRMNNKRFDGRLRFVWRV